MNRERVTAMVTEASTKSMQRMVVTSKCSLYRQELAIPYVSYNKLRIFKQNGYVLNLCILIESNRDDLEESPMNRQKSIIRIS